MTIKDLVVKQNNQGLIGLTIQELERLSKAFIEFEKEAPKESYFDNLEGSHWAHLVEYDRGSIVEWGDRIVDMISNKKERLFLVKDIKVNTINELLKDGWKVNSIYKGELESCACGCGGKYYSNEYVKDGGITEKSLKIMTNKVNAYIEENGDFEVEDLEVKRDYEEGVAGAHLEGGKFDPATWTNKGGTPYKEINIQWATNGTKGFRIYLRKDRTLEEMVSKATIENYNKLLEKESIDTFEDLPEANQKDIINKYLNWKQINEIIDFMEHPDLGENMFDTFDAMDFWLESSHYEAMDEIVKGGK